LEFLDFLLELLFDLSEDSSSLGFTLSLLFFNFIEDISELVSEVDQILSNLGFSTEDNESMIVFVLDGCVDESLSVALADEHQEVVG
jgi:hypothetical protein